MQIGFIGLGKMGSRMVGKLINDGHDVVVWNRSTESVEIIKKNLKISKYPHLLKSLFLPCQSHVSYGLCCRQVKQQK